MNWLPTYEAKIDCGDLKIILKDKKGSKVCFYRQKEERSCPLISAMKVIKLLSQGYIRYWCHAINTQTKEEITENIPAVCEFVDVFPKELPRLPL